MIKLNFAQRVTVRTVKSDGKNMFAKEKAEVKAEINHPSTKVNIDKTIFVKTEKEKRELKIEKAHWKKLLTPEEKAYWKVA